MRVVKPIKYGDEKDDDWGQVQAGAEVEVVFDIGLLSHQPF